MSDAPHSFGWWVLALANGWESVGACILSLGPRAGGAAVHRAETLRAQRGAQRRERWLDRRAAEQAERAAAVPVGTWLGPDDF